MERLLLKQPYLTKIVFKWTPVCSKVCALWQRKGLEWDRNQRQLFAAHSCILWKLHSCNGKRQKWSLCIYTTRPRQSKSLSQSPWFSWSHSPSLSIYISFTFSVCPCTMNSMQQRLCFAQKAAKRTLCTTMNNSSVHFHVLLYPYVGLQSTSYLCL